MGDGRWAMGKHEHETGFRLVNSAEASKIVGIVANIHSFFGSVGIPEAHLVRSSSSKRITFRVLITQLLAI
jgi:hypothetical protein